MLQSQAHLASQQLIQRAQAGDDDAYNQLLARAAERLVLYLRVRLGPRLRTRLDTMDVLQETMIAAHKAFPGFDAQHSDAFFGWLCRIATNRIRDLADHFDAAKRRPPAPPARISEVLEEICARESGPASQAVRGEATEQLLAALNQLADEEREVILLRYFEERTLDDIAERLGRNISWVRRVLGRIVMELGDQLGGHAEGS